jgi:hypothetical protein
MTPECARDSSPTVQRVIARVVLSPKGRSTLEQIYGREQPLAPALQRRLTEGALESVHVRLSADLSDGRRVHAQGGDFGARWPRSGVTIHHRAVDPLPAERRNKGEYEGPHDLEDGINLMLGRDPELHHPPRLAWGQLIDALGEQGMSVTDDDLIPLALTVELEPEIRAILDGPLDPRNTSVEALRERVAAVEVTLEATRRREEILRAVATAEDRPAAISAIAALLAISDTHAATVLDMRLDDFAQSRVRAHARERDELRSAIERHLGA